MVIYFKTHYLVIYIQHISTECLEVLKAGF